MQANPAVTVVIPTHDRRGLVTRALQSALGQKDVDLEVVVVDDGGRDGTAEAVRALGLPGIRVLRHEVARGVSAARNAGLAVATAPWVAFLDDDDLWAPDKLRAQLDAVQSALGAVWSCVGAVRVDSAFRVLAHDRPPSVEEIASWLPEWNPVPGGGSGVLVRTDLARELGGFDEDLSIVADWDFYLRVSRSGACAPVDRPLVAYYVHSDSMVHDPERFLRELDHLGTKYRDLPEVGVRLDRGRWYANLAWMARATGENGTAARLLLRGLVRAGAPTVLRAVATRLRRKVRGDERVTFGYGDTVTWLPTPAGGRPSRG